MTPWIDYAKIVADVVKVLIWPVTILYLIRLFKEDISSLVTKAKEFSVKVAGIEIKFSGSEAGPLLSDVLKELDIATKDFGDAEWRLFGAIASSPTSVQVADLIKLVFGTDFKRGSPEHEMLRKLRNASLIRPDEGSTWRPEKHAGLTTLGQLVKSNRKGHLLANQPFSTGRLVHPSVRDS